MSRRVLGPVVLLTLTAVSLWFMQQDHGDGPRGPSASATATPTSSPDSLAEEPTSAAASAAATASPTGSDQHTSPPRPQTRRTVAALARDFAVAYLSDAERQRWLARLADLTTPALAKSMRTVAQANIPGTVVRDVRLRGTTSYVAAAVVTTDAGSLLVEMAYSGTTWQVTRVQPRRPEE